MSLSPDINRKQIKLSLTWTHTPNIGREAHSIQTTHIWQKTSHYPKKSPQFKLYQKKPQPLTGANAAIHHKS